MCDSESAPRHEAFLRHGGLALHLDVFIEPLSGGATSYRITCTEQETGWILGSALLAGGPDGGPPSLSLSDLAPLLGGSYRLASIFVEVESERLRRQTRRAADRLRRRDRSWLRRARRLVPDAELSIPYESSLERDWLTRTDATGTFLEPAA
ncbi:hypothetical protein [Bradyrhizobium sp. Ce-3]|uniref:hypothetical protein n=1 Tax=Bradyrhizobium sp. Ce-3 TaxID=2913970 RepID=UPI001FC86BC5|nr:hypothetical protein [Bradyrhizobium sp. Ce-3]GKQ53559.1 hypothetical protein BRSPCE3_44140 [Bradyrhizobium sp. Ce-3]